MGAISCPLLFLRKIVIAVRSTGEGSERLSANDISCQRVRQIVACRAVDGFGSQVKTVPELLKTRNFDEISLLTLVTRVVAGKMRTYSAVGSLRPETVLEKRGKNAETKRF